MLVTETEDSTISEEACHYDIVKSKPQNDFFQVNDLEE